MICAHPSCGLSFQPKQRTHRFCSPNCQIAFWRITDRKKYPAIHHAKDKAYRQRYAVSIKKQLRGWWEENRIRVSSQRKEYYREWRKNNKEINRNRRSRRRAREREVLSTLTPDEWTILLEFYNNQCIYCGLSGEMTQDHVIPISKGGAHSFENVVPACSYCNKSKGSMDLDKFLARMESRKV